ncbi:Mitochondrial distribution and morphology protein 10 [Mycena venus]|uniref:Mitochondrial distribution and morphology protein 10 n=1 Tax=Mycena venus TaxID=2733690 RepID=A0A8H6Y2N9_9AGAR|nr:Mitochondrial distribution and morphology protein 10 [Mycena venus]
MAAPRITRRTTLDLATSLGKTAAQITAQFAPVPALGPAAELICGIIQLCQNVTQNKNAAFQLRDRCHRLGLAVYDKYEKENEKGNDKAIHNENITAATESVTQCLKEIYAKMNGWTQMNKVQGFLHQTEISKDIERCHFMLTDCLASFQAQGNDIQQIMSLMQQLMHNNLVTANQQHNGLSSNFSPISGTSAMDIYEGLYLGREKVAIKVVRAVSSNENSLRRFKRECEIWKNLWKIDQGQHVLPFYGFCQEDGPFPYMVSPWQANGTALTYIKNQGDKIDYLKLVKGVARGLQVLHSMNPNPVVHGDMKASNIVIGVAGNPLIADFGLSRIVEDITGIPFSQSRGVSDSYRWFAPEVCIGQGVLSLSSDVYAFGMTVLEIFTHEQPYNNIKHTTEVVIRSAKGEHPPRPTDARAIQRGLDDNLWALLASGRVGASMHPFASYVLRSYYKATGWNEDNLYANITRSSNAILDFTVPKGLHLSVSKSPNSLFKTTYSMNAMPSLNGSVGYIFTSCDLDVKTSGNVRFKDMIERFRVYDQPRRPEGKEEEWLAGERVDKRDYLLYGRFYLPTGRLDALYSTRLSPTLQGLVAAISHPPSNLPADMGNRGGNVSNLIVNLQHDVGKWCTEYTYSADDSMWGVRVLHNFGKLGGPVDTSDDPDKTNPATAGGAGLKRVDEEEAVVGGLKGRYSAGAELYFSAKERSAGVSTGFRFTTLPDATPPSFLAPEPSSSPFSQVSKGPPSQPPTTITALFNPMLGHMSGAYSARVSRDLSLSSRFDFNVYSYESEWTMGAEWWMRSSQTSLDPEDDAIPIPPLSDEPKGEIVGVVKARASTNNVSHLASTASSYFERTRKDVSLMWEGRLRNMLVSLGVVSDFTNRTKPIKAIGLELSYFSSDDSQNKA